MHPCPANIRDRGAFMLCGGMRASHAFSLRRRWVSEAKPDEVFLFLRTNYPR